MEQQVTASNRWIAGIVMTSIFVLGAVAGGGAVAILTRVPASPTSYPYPGPGPAPRFPQRPGPRAFGGDFVALLTRELRLSEAQRDSIRSIFDRQRRATDEALEAVAPRLR